VKAEVKKQVAKSVVVSFDGTKVAEGKIKMSDSGKDKQQQKRGQGTQGNGQLKRQVTVKNLHNIESWEDLRTRVSQHIFYTLVRDQYDVTDLYKALAFSLRDEMAEKWIMTERTTRQNNERMVYYLSMEFYLGRMMKNAVTNLGLDEVVKETMGKLEMKASLDDIYGEERDAGLGNGGLGRLAACYLDSMATLSIPCVGYGLRYEYGIFEQEINAEGEQVEHADNWLEHGYPWEIQRVEDAVEVQMYGRVDAASGAWVDTTKLRAVPHDVPIPGYCNNQIGCLRLWKAKANNELSLASFNTGDYVSAVEEKNKSENITRVLYPNDSTACGKELRLKQEYFLVAASVGDIVNRYLNHHLFGESQDPHTVGSTLSKKLADKKNMPKLKQIMLKIADKIAIQLNDTHPALAIPELMRLLVDVFGIQWEIAFPIVKKSFYYTNHTVLPEALEKWSVGMLQHVLPRHLEIIYRINSVHLADVRLKMGSDSPAVGEMSLVQESPEKMIRMAYLSIVGSSRVNGVAQVHSKLIRNTLFKNFVDFYATENDPNHFTNVTNGVTPRRWLKECNPELSELISTRVKGEWVTNLLKLSELNKLKSDNDFLDKLAAVKTTKKRQLQTFLAKRHSIDINPDWMLSVQVKRIHEYKRQLLNLLNVVVLFNRVRANKYVPPRTIIIGGKAAPAYQRAKKIVRLISKVAHAIDADARARKCLKLIMLPNYDVSTAEIVIPAADLSEQISLAGMEASGTGNMKFMMNGAITIGTLDGANMEISQSVGPDSMFKFGMSIEEVPVERQSYDNAMRRAILDANPEIADALNLIRSGFFMPQTSDYFHDIVDDLFYNDYYMVLKDMPAYVDAQDRAGALFYAKADAKRRWLAASLDNIANSGRFSSDESIKNYAKEIWHVKYDDALK